MVHFSVKLVVHFIVAVTFTELGVNISAGSLKGMVLSILKIFAHWYFLMVILSIIVLYRLFDALEKAGVIKKFSDIVTKAMKSELYISGECFPKITEIQAFIQCIQGAP